MVSSEQEMLQRYVASGDAEAFRALVEAHRDMVFSVCRRILRNAADAEDAAQNCFLELARRAASLKAPIAGWLHDVAVHVAVDLRRQRVSRAAWEARAAQLKREYHGTTWDDVQELVNETISQLPERLRVPIVLHYLEGKRQEEIAAALGISQSAVSKRLTQGFEALRARLKRTGVVVGGVALAGLLAANAVEAAPPTLVCNAGKMAYAGLATGSNTAPVLGGIGVLKWGIVTTVAAAALVTGGVLADKVMSAEAVRQPGAVVQSAPQAKAPKVKAKEQFLKGSVLLSDGKPAVGAVVKLYYCHDISGYGSRWLSETKTDAAGDFKLANPDFDAPSLIPFGPILRRQILVTYPGYAFKVLQVDPNKTEASRIILAKGRTITCTVVDKQGQAIAGVRVWPNSGLFDLQSGYFWVLNPFHQKWAGEQMSVVPDANGKAVLSDMPRRFMMLSADSGQAMGFWGVDETTAELKRSLDYPSMTLHGRVVRAGTGAPVAGAVVASHAEYFFAWTATDKNGRFELRMTGWADDLVARLGPMGERPVIVVSDPTRNPSFVNAFVGAKGFDPKRELKITVSSGKLLTGQFADAATGKSICGACVGFATFAKDIGFENVCDLRTTDREGMYRMCVSGDKGHISAREMPAGRVLVTEPDQGRDVDIVGATSQHDTTLSIREEGTIDIVARTPDGALAASAHVTYAQPQDRDARLSAQTDDSGLVHLAGLAMGEPFFAYVISSDGKFAESVAGIVGKAGYEEPVDLLLRPARTGKIVLKDKDGKNVLGDRVTVYCSRGGAGQVFVCGDERSQGDPITCAGGLLPNEQYVLEIRKEGYKSFFNLPWSFTAQEKEPTLTLDLQTGNSWESAKPPPPLPTQEEFEAALAGLKDATRKEADPVQPSLTWYVLKDGIAMVDSARREVKRLSELMGETDLAVSQIAFGKDRVWLGTNKGLFAWDRKDMFWSRFAIDGKYVDLPVKELEMTKAGALDVTITQGSQLRRFEFESKSGNWNELPGK